MLQLQRIRKTLNKKKEPNMKNITMTVYNFDELSEFAKDRARDWVRESLFDYDWWDSVYDDAKNIGFKIKGFDLYKHDIKGDLTLPVNEVCKLIYANHGKKRCTYKLAKTIDQRKANDDDDTVNNFCHDLSQEYLSMLQHEADYMASNEYVDECIRANEYEFTENGKREG